MSNIHKLTGHSLPGEVNTDLADELRRLLDRVESGEIVGMAWAWYSGPANDTVGTGWEGAGGTSWQLHSGIAMLSHRFAQSLISED